MIHRPTLVTHTIAGLSMSDGGPSYSVPALNSALETAGATSMIRTVRTDHGGSHPWPVSNTIIHDPDGGLLRALRGSTGLKAALARDARDGAIIHAHGLWLLPNMYPAWIKRQFPSVPIVHSPRGMLAPAALQISGWRKRAVWALWQRNALQAADCIHATAESEHAEIRSAGLFNPIAVISNGIDVPDLSEVRPCSGPQRTILSLGRLHPKKRLDHLVRAWAELEPHYKNWRVRIIGPAEGAYDVELRRLAASLSICRLTIEEPVYGTDKLATYRASDIFVLPTSNENFGMVVAEALAAGVPVISTKGAPWPGLVRERCGWWIDHGPAPLVRALSVAMDLDRTTLNEMGCRGRSWMIRDFSWKRVAEDMLSVYSWLREEGPVPACVRID
jgi:glycosyltransferase involved in cell wall biosynthesis